MMVHLTSFPKNSFLIFAPNNTFVCMQLNVVFAFSDIQLSDAWRNGCVSGGCSTPVQTRTAGSGHARASPTAGDLRHHGQVLQHHGEAAEGAAMLSKGRNIYLVSGCATTGELLVHKLYLM